LWPLAAIAAVIAVAGILVWTVWRSQHRGDLSTFGGFVIAVRWHTPARLLHFLEDARQRDVLRTVGPVYQFRHARLQDRLAGQAAPK
jgi:hypothetical protein